MELLLFGLAAVGIFGLIMAMLMMPAVQNAERLRGTRLTTTDGTITTAWTHPTVANKGYYVEVRAIASDGSTTASYVRAASFENNAGTLTQVGATTSIVTHEDIAAPMDVAFDTSGTDIRFRVTGDPGRRLIWAISTDVYEVGA